MTGTKPVIHFTYSKTNVQRQLRRICFTGVRGVGKSSLLREIQIQDLNLFFASGSDILQEMMGDTYSQFEFLPENKKYAYRLKIRETLENKQKQNNKDLLVDSHLTVYNMKTDRIDVIFTHRDYEFYTDIILLDSTPELILDHRQRDAKKKRITDSGIIQRELVFERKMAREVSKNYGINLHIIQMKNDAVYDLENIIKCHNN